MMNVFNCFKSGFGPVSLNALSKNEFLKIIMKISPRLPRSMTINSYVHLLSPSTFLSCSNNPFSGYALPTGHLETHHLASREIHQAAAQNTLTVLAAGIDAGGPPDFGYRLGFVNVAVQAQHRLVGFNCLAH